MFVVGDVGFCFNSINKMIAGVSENKNDIKNNALHTFGRQRSINHVLITTQWNVTNFQMEAFTLSKHCIHN